MKCPFCEIPCDNDHCPYNRDITYEREIKRLEEENKRLREQLIELMRKIWNKN